jgi:uncharacterized protein YoxC
MELQTAGVILIVIGIAAVVLLIMLRREVLRANDTMDEVLRGHRTIRIDFALFQKRLAELEARLDERPWLKD